MEMKLRRHGKEAQRSELFTKVVLLLEESQVRIQAGQVGPKGLAGAVTSGAGCAELGGPHGAGRA